MTHQLTKIRDFVENYYLGYSNRDLRIIQFYDENFIGLDGISNKIYNKLTWIKALEHDFSELSEPFEIKIIDFQIRIQDSGSVIVTLISLWCIQLFEDSPQFDKIRSVIILEPSESSFKIIHLSHSVSLLPLDRDDVFPTKLLNFLKQFANYLNGIKVHNK